MENLTIKKNQLVIKFGNSGALTTSQNLIKQFRDIVKAYDREIIEELNILFMGIY